MAPQPNLEPEAALVMVVEDDVLIRIAIAEAMREAGLRVVEAASADEAWSFLQATTAVDLIFSDIQMPGSMDGMELACRVKGNFDHILIVLTSGAGMTASSGLPDHFISKPYRLDEVVASIMRMLAKKKSAP